MAHRHHRESPMSPSFPSRACRSIPPLGGRCPIDAPSGPCIRPKSLISGICHKTKPPYTSFRHCHIHIHFSSGEFFSKPCYYKQSPPEVIEIMIQVSAGARPKARAKAGAETEFTCRREIADRILKATGLAHAEREQLLNSSLMQSQCRFTSSESREPSIPPTLKRKGCEMTEEEIMALTHSYSAEDPEEFMSKLRDIAQLRPEAQLVWDFISKLRYIAARSQTKGGSQSAVSGKAESEVNPQENPKAAPVQHQCPRKKRAKSR